MMRREPMRESTGSFYCINSDRGKPDSQIILGG
nr:MAG TPA: hypothetical protein [Caudoviricetes sp.]